MSIQSPIHFFSQTEKKVLDFASILQYIVIMRHKEKIGGRMDKSLVAKLKRLNRELLKILQYIVIMRRKEKIGGRMDKSLVVKLKNLNRALLKRRLLLKRKIGAERVEISSVDIANLHIALDVSDGYNDIFELINLM